MRHNSLIFFFWHKCSNELFHLTWNPHISFKLKAIFTTADTIKHDTANDALQHFSTLTLKRSLACDFGPRTNFFLSYTEASFQIYTRLIVGNNEAQRRFENDFTTVGNCADHVAKRFKLNEKWILWMKRKRQRIFIQSARLSQFRMFHWCRLTGSDVD